MATAGTVIERSLRLLGQIGAGETPTDDEYADCLEALNALLDSWRNERLLCYARQEESLTLSAATASYTVGPSGTLTTTRPVAIERAWIVDGGNSYEVWPMSEDEYAALPAKTTQSNWPDRFLFRPSMANATVIVYPVPDATRTMKLLTRVVLSSFASTSTTVTLPPGWERALTNNLAIEIAPEYEAPVPPSVLKAANESLAGIKRANKYAQPTQTVTELGVMFAPRRANILSGDV